MILWWFQVCVWEQCGKLIQLGGGCVFGADHQLGSEQGPCSARAWAEPLFPLENPKLWGSCGITGVRGSGSHRSGPGRCPGRCPGQCPGQCPANPTWRWPCPCWGVVPSAVCAGATGPAQPLSRLQLVRLCNEGARKMERTEMMYTINSQLEFKIKVGSGSYS